MANPLMIVTGVTLNARTMPPSSGATLLKMRAATTTTARPTPMPTTIPMRDATTAYSVPSMMKERTSRLRFMPIARSMPSSGFRSSASITKMFTSKRRPAMMAKLPMNRNSEPSPSPSAFA